MKSIRFFCQRTTGLFVRMMKFVVVVYTYSTAVGLSSREYQSSTSLELANHMAGLI